MMKAFYKVKNYQPQRSIGYLLRNSSKLITAQIENLFVQRDVSFMQWLVLMNLRSKKIKTAAEICHAFNYDSGAITRLLDQMERRGFIARERSVEDRRIVNLALTETGYKTTDVFLPAVVELYNTVLEDFTESEANILVDLLTRLNNKLAEMPKAMAA